MTRRETRPARILDRSNMEKLLHAKALFERASKMYGQAADASTKTAEGPTYLVDALVEIRQEVEDIKAMLRRTKPS